MGKLKDFSAIDEKRLCGCDLSKGRHCYPGLKKMCHGK